MCENMETTYITSENINQFTFKDINIEKGFKTRFDEQSSQHNGIVSISFDGVKLIDVLDKSTSKLIVEYQGSLRRIDDEKDFIKYLDVKLNHVHFDDVGKKIVSLDTKLSNLRKMQQSMADELGITLDELDEML